MQEGRERKSDNIGNNLFVTICCTAIAHTVMEVGHTNTNDSFIRDGAVEWSFPVSCHRENLQSHTLPLRPRPALTFCSGQKVSKEPLKGTIRVRG